ncbi:MAG TPA: MBL fold metallo-hydrolase [Dehalococcoidia bacterium]|nr:MBL fold metallo-hydrolase [Dehalococcoidia bacterium]
MTQSGNEEHRPEDRDRNMLDEEIFPDVVKIAQTWPISGPSGLVITCEGLVVVDTGVGFREGDDRVRKIRERTDIPFHTIIYTHGHVDHVGGAAAFLKDAEDRGHRRPVIIGHELVAQRLDKYRMLKGRRAYIASLQFPRTQDDSPGSQDWTNVREPSYVYPDSTFHDYMEFRLGGLTFEIRHAPGETDDALWVWVPERKVAFIGDLLLGGCPNTGNPLKEQRYTLEWAENLEKIAEKKPDFVVGSGAVISGEAVNERLTNTAKLLRYINDEVVRLLNEGCWIEEILERVKVPAELVDKPYLAGNYGHPIFVIHDVYRRYTGWYDGNPSTLFPSKEAAIAGEVLQLTGAGNVIERARQLKEEGNVQLALHLLDFVVKGTVDASLRNEAMLLKAEFLDVRTGEVHNFIAGNIMRTSAGLLRREIGQP